jgi:hypothetical protein
MNMTQIARVDNLIRSVLHAEFGQQEPSSTTREALLEQAARENVRRSMIGPSIPPLAEGLCEGADQPQLEPEFPVAILTDSLRRRQLLLLAAPLYAVHR